MADSQSGAVGDRQPALGADSALLKVFINYRHEDTEEPALRLYEKLAAHFGGEHVFIDTKLEAGTRWLEEIKQHGAEGGAFLALIGRTWLASLKERENLKPGEPQDYVALELEFALGQWPGRVIPVLHGRATMPDAISLPKAIRALAGIQAMALRPLSFDQDAEQLIAKLDGVAREQARGEAPNGKAQPVLAGELADASVRPGRPDGASSKRPAIPAPEEEHYDEVLSFMVDDGSVVPVLGPGVRGSLPDAKQLAAYLAQEFGLSPVALDLAEIAQRVSVTKGPDSLGKAMAKALTPQPEPSDTHRFLARFPKRLQELGLPERYQMIVTTNYDSALERAFEAEGEQYDLVVFLANGADQGKFLHVPWQGKPGVIPEANAYKQFPIKGEDELERTVIVQINGAVEGGEGDYRWDKSYVLTEDQYIDYLATDQITRVVPHQILNKLTSSHCLFLGYATQDWSLRVLLKRVWQGKPLEENSWAIEREPDALEKVSWKRFQVELLASAPDDYANELQARMASWRAGGG